MAYKSIVAYVEHMEGYHNYWQRKYKIKNEPYDPTLFKDIEIFREWCDKYKVTHYREGMREWYNLNPRKNYGYRYHYLWGITPLQDHTDMFRTENKKMIFVTQPYADLEKIKQEKVEEWCRERGLKLTISKDLSWHYPGQTILLQYTINDNDTFNNFLLKNKLNRRL